jgi:hypothetical protein
MHKRGQNGNKKNQQMKSQDFTAALLVDQTPEEVFTAINNIRGWWSEDIEGSTDKLNHEFMYRDKHLRSKMKITELIPGKKSRLECPRKSNG